MTVRYRKYTTTLWYEEDGIVHTSSGWIGTVRLPKETYILFLQKVRPKAIYLRHETKLLPAKVRALNKARAEQLAELPDPDFYS